MIATNDLFWSFHFVYFYRNRTCYLWTKRRLPSVYNPRKLSKGHFRVCVRYENLSDSDIVRLFTCFINHPIEVNNRYCSFQMPGMGIQTEKGMELPEGLKAFIAERNQAIDELTKIKGSRAFGIEPVREDCLDYLER